MARVRSGGAERWSQNASNAGPTYETGINNPRRDWEATTKSAENNWSQAIQGAITKKMFSKGVTKAGNEKWRSRAVNVGKQRYVQGVQSGSTNYATGMAPYLTTIESTTLPPRYPRGDPRNLDRVKAITEALRQKKLN